MSRRLQRTNFGTPDFFRAKTQGARANAWIGVRLDVLPAD